MSQYLTELLTLMVEDAYGDLCSTIFDSLIRNGRQTASGINQSTRLGLKRTRAGLAVLVKQHLVLWSTTDGQTHYNIDVRTAYLIVRYGKISYLFERRFGRAGRQVAEHVLVSGNLRISSLIADYEAARQHHNSLAHRHGKRARTAAGNSQNQDGGAEEQPVSLDAADETTSPTTHQFNAVESTGQLRQLIKTLLDAEYLTPERLINYKPQSEIHDDAERVVREALFPKGPRGTRENTEFRHQVALTKQRWRNGDLAALDAARTAKKAKSSKLNDAVVQDLGRVGGTGDAAGDDGIILNMDTVLRVNEEKVAVLIRNQQLTRLAERYLGEITAHVYGALLDALEDQVPRCYETIDRDGLEEDAEPVPATSSGAVLRLISSSVNLAAGLSSNAVTPELSQASSPTEFGGDNRGGGAPVSTLELVREHLHILSEDPREFVHWAAGESAEWHVDYSHLSEVLVTTEIDNTITARFSAMASRVIRVLREKGRMEEKQISLVGMIQSKDARIVLNSMQEAGYVGVQEVPKEGARQTARSIWLWHFSDTRCRRVILDEAYKTMSRAVQRMRHHRLESAAVVDKAERAAALPDAVTLTRAEKEAVATWRMVERRLLAQLARLDDVVGALRDFNPYRPDAFTLQ